MSKAVRRPVGATPVRINGRRRFPSVSANRFGSLCIVAESGGDIRTRSNCDLEYIKGRVKQNERSSKSFLGFCSCGGRTRSSSSVIATSLKAVAI